MESILATASHHLGRQAYHTRDNPFLRAVMGRQVTAAERDTLDLACAGELDVSAWLTTPQGKSALDGLRVGVLPRSLQVVMRDDREHVGVESVHAFCDASRFWWLVSELWCIEAGRLLDAALPAEVIGYRMHTRFTESPAQSPTMFKPWRESHRRWQLSATRIAAEHEGQLIAASTLDIRDFYYSVHARPTEIVAEFSSAIDADASLSAAGRAFTELLDGLHARYADRLIETPPRVGAAACGTCPLPVGLPSSQVLANLVIAVGLKDMAGPSVVGITAYADDILVLSRLTPFVGEPMRDYFERLGIVSGTDLPTLASEAGRRLAVLAVGFEKSEVSYARVTSPPAEPPVETHEVDAEDPDPTSRPASDGDLQGLAMGGIGDVNPDFSAAPSTDWAGGFGQCSNRRFAANVCRDS